MCCFGTITIMDGSKQTKKNPTPEETRKHIYSNTPAQEDGRKGSQSLN